MRFGPTVLPGDPDELFAAATQLTSDSSLQMASTAVLAGLDHLSRAGTAASVFHLHAGTQHLSQSLSRLTEVRGRAASALRHFATELRAHQADQIYRAEFQPFTPPRLEYPHSAADQQCAHTLERCIDDLLTLLTSTTRANAALGPHTYDPVATLTRTLFTPSLDPAEVAATWKQLTRLPGFSTETLITDHAFTLARLNGIPFSVMDAASRYSLDYAIDPRFPEHLAEAHSRMGLDQAELSLFEFEQDLLAIAASLQQAELNASQPEAVQLLGLGAHQGSPTAAIALGTLDQATTTGVFVAGMNSGVRTLDHTIDGFTQVRGHQPSTSLVIWVGYDAPNLFEEMLQGHADAGALKLTGFLDGIEAQRALTGTPEDARLVVIGHSYGTNVVAESLRATAADVDAFVSLGSAGLAFGTTADDLRVSEIYVTHASGDNIAATVGQHVHFRSRSDGGGGYEARVDPRSLSNAVEFSSEKTPIGEAVTMHNLRDPINWVGVPLVGTRLQWIADHADGISAADEIGYLDPTSSTVAALTQIMNGGSP